MNEIRQVGHGGETVMGEKEGKGLENDLDRERISQGIRRSKVQLK